MRIRDENNTTINRFELELRTRQETVVAYQGMNVFDCDLHIVEPPDLWQRYIDPAYKPIAPVGLNEYVEDLRIRVGERIRPRDALIRPPADKTNVFYTSRAQRYEDAHRRHWSPDVTLDAMNVEGVDCAVLFPSRGLWVIADDHMDQQFAAAICRAYNDWLYEFTQTDPRRLIACGMISPHDVRDAIDEAKRCAARGFKAVFMRPNLFRGRNWHDRYYEPLWDTLEELDLSLGFHEAYGPDLPQVSDRFGADSLLVHAACHPMEQMLCCISLIGGGVLARHPGLRVGFLEANCSWVPLVLFRLEEHFEADKGFSRNLDSLTLEPMTYFSRQCFVSVECEERFVKQVVEFIGDGNILFSNDWPHLDSKYPHATRTFLELPLSRESQRKILWDNCCRFYNLPLTYAEPICRKQDTL